MNIKEQKQENTKEPDAAPEYPIEILELNQQNIELLWRKFGEQLPDYKRGAKALFSAFTPVFSGVDVSLMVNANAQAEKLNEEINALGNFLLKHTGVELPIAITVDPSAASTTIKPYTDEEKMKRLIEKNPAVKLLQQRFDLTLDYDN